VYVSVCVCVFFAQYQCVKLNAEAGFVFGMPSNYLYDRDGQVRMGHVLRFNLEAIFKNQNAQTLFSSGASYQIHLVAYCFRMGAWMSENMTTQHKQLHSVADEKVLLCKSVCSSVSVTANVPYTTLQPFYGSLDFVRDFLSELVPER